jgi:hypothetical protein
MSTPYSGPRSTLRVRVPVPVCEPSAGGVEQPYLAVLDVMGRAHLIIGNRHNQTKDQPRTCGTSLTRCDNRATTPPRQPKAATATNSICQIEKAASTTPVPGLYRSPDATDGFRW